MLRLFAQVRADCYCGKSISSWCVNAARHRAEARSRNRSESRLDSLCGIDAMWRDRCDACFAARSVVGSRGAGDHTAARPFDQPDYRPSADPAATPKIRATERTTSQSYRRTPTSIATYSMSRNPKIIPPPGTVRCELRAEPHFPLHPASRRVASVRSVTLAIR